MITELHIINALHKVLKKYFPDIPIIDKDYKGVERPAFYIQDTSRHDENISSEFFKSIKGFNITYYGSDKNTGNVELLKIKEFLSNIFLKPIKIIINTDKNVKKLFYVEVDNFDVRVNRQENYVTCDLVIEIQQRKINVFIEENEKLEDSIIVDYENNIDSDNYNTELMQNIVSKTEINK
jgi:hypothetical protein